MFFLIFSLTGPSSWHPYCQTDMWVQASASLIDSGQLFTHWSIPQPIFKQIHFCTTSSGRFCSLKETALIAVVPAHPGSAAATGSSGRLLGPTGIADCCGHGHIQQSRTSTPPNLRKTWAGCTDYFMSSFRRPSFSLHFCLHKWPPLARNWENHKIAKILVEPAGAQTR